MTGNPEGWKTHINGLKELVRLRGGPEFLEENEQLGITISWYVPLSSSSFPTLSVISYLVFIFSLCINSI